jgi:DNA-binding NtrC family response regulator
VDVRIIAATNRDIDRMVREGKFREDLYYRLNIIPIMLPPLRERGNDVDLLAKHFIAEFATEFRRQIIGVTPTGLAKLRAYPWPGNVRELRNVIERAVLLCKRNELDVDDFVLGHGEEKPWADGFRLPPGGVKLADVEEQLVRQALRQTNNNQTHAAELLGISRDQLRYRMEKYGLL